MGRKTWSGEEEVTYRRPTPCGLEKWNERQDILVLVCVIGIGMNCRMLQSSLVLRVRVEFEDLISWSCVVRRFELDDMTSSALLWRSGMGRTTTSGVSVLLEVDRSAIRSLALLSVLWRSGLGRKAIPSSLVLRVRAEFENLIHGRL